MATKKKIKKAKRVSPKKHAKHKLHAADYDFIIISGGGLVIILLAVFLLF